MMRKSRNAAAAVKARARAGFLRQQPARSPRVCSPPERSCHPIATQAPAREFRTARWHRRRRFRSRRSRSHPCPPPLHAMCGSQSPTVHHVAHGRKPTHATSFQLTRTRNLPREPSRRSKWRERCPKRALATKVGASRSPEHAEQSSTSTRRGPEPPPLAGKRERRAKPPAEAG